MAKFEIRWEAPEFEYREKEISWYWLSIIAAALMIAFAVWDKDFLFGFFVVIAEVLFIVWGNKIPQMHMFTVTDTEVNIGGYKTYLIKELESWSADTGGGGWDEVVFHFRSRLHPPLTLIVPEESMTDLRANLKTVLKEIEHQPTLLDSIEKLLRF